MAVCRQGQAILRTFGPVRKEAEILRTALGGFAHELDGLAGVVGFQQGNLFGMICDQVCYGVKQPFSLGGTGPAPGGKGGPGGLRGGIDI